MSVAPVAVALGALLHRRLYYYGFSKAQEGAERKIRRPLRGPVTSILRFLPAVKREFILKDLRLFFRDNTQWSQLILLAVLLMVYLFNIKSLPLHSGDESDAALWLYSWALAQQRDERPPPRAALPTVRE